MCRCAMLDFAISGTGQLSSEVRRLGFATFAQIAEHVRMLAYGRVANTGDALAILRCGRGTCSSKHRFLAALAHECGQTDVTLTLGLYEMSERNTPGIGEILAAGRVSAIPEAHCYLTYRGSRYDFTGLTAGSTSPFDSLIEERAVAPDDLPITKERYHRAAVAGWADANGIDRDCAWQLREQCIAELARARSSHERPVSG